MGENSYLKDKFRADVFKEIEEYIGYVYGDDYHGNDKLIVNPFDMSVSHGTRSVDEIEKKYDYFDTFGLIKRDGEFTFTPDPVGIECVVIITRAVRFRITNVSINTPIIATNPCSTGWSTFATACA